MNRHDKVWVPGVPPVSGGKGHTAERHQTVAAAVRQIPNHALGRMVALTAIVLSATCTGGGGRDASDARESPTQPLASAAPSAGGSVEELVQVNGRGLYLACTPGEGPTVVFSHGVGGQSGDWDATLSNLVDIPTCVYDRVNVGLSDREAGRHSATDDVEDLHALLGAAEIEPPYVLVGHSFGGMEMLMYAGMYPEDVEGIVLADATLPFESLLDPPDLRAEIRAELNANPEEVDFYGAYAEARALVASIAGVPVTYLFGAQQVLPPEWEEGAYEAALHRFLDGLPDGRLIELAADHDLPLDEPEAIADAVRQTLSASD
jgi:pimeloyl-ACP methyl ester carboxylesterase